MVYKVKGKKPKRGRRSAIFKVRSIAGFTPKGYRVTGINLKKSMKDTEIVFRKISPKKKK